MPEICLVHLVWAAHGPEPLRRFLASYQRHPAGLPHRLLIVSKGPGDFGALLDGIASERLEVPEKLRDLGAYRVAAERIEEPYVCFLNSHSEVLADGWLGTLHDHARQPGVGLVGATGSFESAYSAGPRPLRPFLRCYFDPAPNPHVRTNAFMLPLEVLRRLEWPLVRRKWHALQLESGRRSITRQVTERGLEALVVGRDGRGYRADEWPQSGTFRSGDQGNLLVADNRTRQYAEADPAFRRLLADYAWGTPLP
jgi:hypothetical protein